MTESITHPSGPETVQSAPELEALDEGLYEATRPHLRAALEHTLAMGRTVQDWADFCLEKFGGVVVPHLQRLLWELREQSVRIEGWSDAARGTLFGTPLAPEQRDEWIREAAYFRAERRGFAGGSADEDWAEAEREVDRWAAANAGLLGRGRMAVISLGELATRGFEGIQATLVGWMERREQSAASSEA